MNLHLLLLLTCVCASHAYNILCAFPLPSHSHNQLGKGIVDILLNAGHSVTWITPYGEKVGKDIPKTLKVIDVSPVQRFVQGTDLATLASRNLGSGFRFVQDFARNVNVEMLKTPAVIDAIINTQYDAVVTEKFIVDYDAGIAAVQQVPWIILNGIQMTPSMEAQVDEVRSVSTVPVLFNDSPIPMPFYKRLINVLVYSFMTVAVFLGQTEAQELYTTLFSPLASARGVQLPPLEDAVHNVSVVLLNSHESLSPAFSVPPNVLSVAGYHIERNPPALPRDLRDIMDNSPQGVVYFSMGSILKSASLTPELKTSLLNIFSKLPFTVLWKFEEKMEGKLPSNVHIRKWFPQLSVLAHPNLRLFITHSGGLSTLEAVHSGVPLLAVPVFGDQPSNAERAVRNGFALKVTFSLEMAEEFEEKLNEILNDDKYYKRAKELSKLFRNRAIHPTDLIKHYIELAIETKGAYHLRSVSLQYPWYARWMLDVALVLIAVTIGLLATCIFIIRLCIRKIRGDKHTKTVDKKKKKK